MPQNQDQLPIALSVAGSDPSGGAGIQADLKTFTIIGVYSGAIPTTLTSQNTRGVSTCFPLPPHFIRQQLNDVLSDLNVTHIKIGMTGSREIVEIIGEILEDFSGMVVYDPVLKSSTGQALFSGNDSHLLAPIIKHSTVLTPNLHELEQLSGRKLDDSDTALAAGKELLHRFYKLKAICLKGGHINEQGKIVTDYLIEKKGKAAEHYTVSTIRHPRISTRNSHGTGCSFASAFTAFHLLTGDIPKAFGKTAQFMGELLEKSTPYSIGHGTGPLMHHLWKKN